MGTADADVPRSCMFTLAETKQTYVLGGTSLSVVYIKASVCKESAKESAFQEDSCKSIMDTTSTQNRTLTKDKKEANEHKKKVEKWQKAHENRMRSQKKFLKQ